RWSEVRETNQVLDGLRGGAIRSAEPLFAGSGAAGGALWERAADAMLPLLAGDAERIAAFLERLPAPRPVADRLLTLSPEELFGPGAPPEAAAEGLSALRNASPRAWRS